MAILTDGTALDDLVRLNKRTVSARIMTDPEVYDLELERVFGRNWIFVAHESEIPKPGDFVSRYIGADPVIVSRDADGKPHVLLNSCSHRGAQVCRAECGNATVFKCPYHGWAYRNTGDLVAVLAEADAYPNGIDKQLLGLRAARAECYQGLIFATFNAAAPSLREYLGDITWYLDILLGLADNGMEVAGPPQRWVIDCNWKLGADNFSADGYHAATTHKSLAECGLMPPEFLGREALFGVNVTDPETGHGMRCLNLSRAASIESAAAGMGMPPELVPQISKNLSPEQMEVLLQYPPAVGNVYPNLSWLNAPFVTEYGGPLEPMISIRLWHPRGPGQMEVWNWALVQKDAPQELKDAGRRCVIRTFGSAGIFEQDDAETWSGIQRAIRGVQGRERELTYFSSIPANTTDWPGPCDSYAGFAAEDNQWNLYRRWLKDMLAESPR